MAKLLLNCKVPLIRDCRLNRAGPGLQCGANVWIYAGSRTERRLSSKCRRPLLHVVCFHLRRCIRWILRVSQINSRSFQVRRNCEGATDDCLSSPKSGTPGKAETRLEIRPPVRRVIKPSTESIRTHHSVRYRIVAGKLQRAGQNIYRGLTIVGFNPRSTRLITEAQV